MNKRTVVCVKMYTTLTAIIIVFGGYLMYNLIAAGHIELILLGVVVWAGAIAQSLFVRYFHIRWARCFWEKMELYMEAEK